jgi:hypothetical protein
MRSKGPKLLVPEGVLSPTTSFTLILMIKYTVFGPVLRVASVARSPNHSAIIL